MVRLRVLGFVAVVLVCEALAATPIQYCPQDYCLTPSLELPIPSVTATNVSEGVAQSLSSGPQSEPTHPTSFQPNVDCFNVDTREVRAPLVVEPDAENYSTLTQQLTDLNYHTSTCHLVTGSNCNRRGSFDAQRRQCTSCHDGFTGPECADQPCPQDCSNQGYCHNSICYCYGGFKGSACDLNACENNCNNNGKCIGGSCVCNSGFTGPTCGSTTCLHECSFHGSCNNGVCKCDDQYTGEDCSEAVCPSNCYSSLGHGICVDGTCACNTNWVGHSCETANCPNACSGHGQCLQESGECRCNEGYTGNDCSQSTCAVDCGDHGVCAGTTCKCDYGFSGAACLPACPYNCSGRGECSKAPDEYKCFCGKGYTGDFCQYTTCPFDCSGHGSCDTNTDKCICSSGWMGLDCALPVCHGGQEFAEGLCSSNGYCEDSGTCVCAEGWRGEKCNTKGCLNSCSNHGTCTPELTCECEPGFKGADCSEPTCPNECSGNGVCRHDENGFSCTCIPGFDGYDCSRKKCPGDCSNHGTCIASQCYCTDGFIGEDCGTQPCGDCSGHGTCDPKTKKCTCAEGYKGSICEARTCPGFQHGSECFDHGACIQGSCLCYAGYTGPSCAETCRSGPGYPTGTLCSGHGKCTHQGLCACDPGWNGPECNTISCPMQCNGNGYCHNGTCECDFRHEGEECEHEINVPGAGDEMCDCSMDCTVLCLQHCAGIHERFGIFEGHSCFYKCSRSCVVGCATRGLASIEHFVPDVSSDDFKHLLAVDREQNTDNISQSRLDTRVTDGSLVQENAQGIVAEEEALPTMDD